MCSAHCCCTHACDTRLAQPAAPTDVHRCRVRSRVEKGRRPREHLLIRLHAGDEPLQRAVADVVGDVAVVPLVPRARRRRRRRRGAAVHLRSLPEADLAQDEQQRGGQLLGQAPRLYGATTGSSLRTGPRRRILCLRHGAVSRCARLRRMCSTYRTRHRRVTHVSWTWNTGRAPPARRESGPGRPSRGGCTTPVRSARTAAGRSRSRRPSSSSPPSRASPACARTT